MTVSWDRGNGCTRIGLWGGRQEDRTIAGEREYGAPLKDSRTRAAISRPAASNEIQMCRFRERRLLVACRRISLSISAASTTATATAPSAAALCARLRTVMGRSTGILRWHTIGAGRDRSHEACNDQQRPPGIDLAHIGLRDRRPDVLGASSVALNLTSNK